MKNILIIDDDEFILLGLSKAISMCERTSGVLTAQHGKQAVDILGRHPVDLVVTDVTMPIMNGYEVVDYINRNYPCVPVYVMTGDYLPDIKTKFASGSVTDFISKPFSFRELAADILIKLHQAGQPNQA
jgi:YesN/AraC family two-component response regulator